MAEVRKDAIALKSEAGLSSGILFFELPNSGERMARAGKVLGICWGLAVVTLFIPIAHFFLVPTFAIAGPVMAFMKYQATEIAEKAEGVCPECKKEISIPLEPKDKLPKWTYCPECNKPVQLVYHVGPAEQ